ncbi:D-inositol-3-phosphate glycosyltransferase [uncultured archaeon]|nr:D-inositol-3-phosphate glycosyltransferase [uncultured archaeon]
MNVAMIGDKREISKGTGIERYTEELLNGLGKKVEIEFMGTSTSSQFTEITNHTIISPLKILWLKNDFDLFHAVAPVNALSFPLLGKPTVITYHDLTSMLYKKGSKFHVRLTVPFFYRVGKYCNKVIANSTQTKEELVKYLNFPDEKIEVVNLGVDEKFKPIKRDEKDYFVIGYLGSLIERKRIDYLIKSFYYLKFSKINVKLNIYGNKSQNYSKLYRLVKELKIDKNVEFKGSVTDDSLVDVYNSFDIFVLPSDSEGFGLPILEAQRCGVPVIIRDNANIPREVTKCCVRAKSEKDMANKIYELLINPELRRNIISIGEKYSRLFTWEKTVGKTLKIYEKILEI